MITGDPGNWPKAPALQRTATMPSATFTADMAKAVRIGNSPDGRTFQQIAMPRVERDFTVTCHVGVLVRLPGVYPNDR